MFTLSDHVWTGENGETENLPMYAALFSHHWCLKEHRETRWTQRYAENVENFIVLLRIGKLSFICSSPYYTPRVADPVGPQPAGKVGQKINPGGKNTLKFQLHWGITLWFHSHSKSNGKKCTPKPSLLAFFERKNKQISYPTCISIEI